MLTPLKKERAIFFKKAIGRIQAVKPLNQQEIADVLGISLSFLSQICNLGRAPSFRTLLLLEEKFQIAIPDHLNNVEPIKTQYDRQEQKENSVGFDAAFSQQIETKTIHVHHHFDEETLSLLKDILQKASSL